MRKDSIFLFDVAKSKNAKKTIKIIISNIDCLNSILNENVINSFVKVFELFDTISKEKEERIR